MNSIDSQVVGKDELFLILDGARIDALRYIYDQDDSPELDILYRGTPHEPVRAVSPCIARLSNCDWWRDRETDWRPHGILIEATAGLNVVANHLRSLLSVRLPDGAFSYLRFYSPAQIEPFLSSLSDHDINSISGPITNWHYFLPAEGWKTISAGGRGNSLDSAKEGWFQVSENHLRAMEHANETNFLKRLVHQGGWEVSPESMSRIKEVVSDAKSFGFRSQRDIATYAELASIYGAGLEEAKVKAILSSANKPAEVRLGMVDRMLSYGDA